MTLMSAKFHFTKFRLVKVFIAALAQTLAARLLHSTVSHDAKKGRGSLFISHDVLCTALLISCDRIRLVW